MSGEIYRSVEIYYEIEAIPEKYNHPLDFRNAAMELIEAALEAQQAGEWSGAEIGMGEVNFGFSVQDFDQAEGIIRDAVAGTDFANIRKITRFEMDESTMQAMEEDARQNAISVWGLLWKMITHRLFRRG